MMPTPKQKLEAAYQYGLAHGRQMMADTKAVLSIDYHRDAARCLARACGRPSQEVIAQVCAYHRERLDAVPSLTTYPELRGYRDRLDARARGYRDAGVDDVTLALMTTLSFWRETRLLQETGRGYEALPQPEKCRVVYVPHSDVGAIRAKNLDDQIAYYQPEPPVAPGTPWPYPHPLVFDGVGSGLHIDEIPPEIFPVEPHGLCQELCTTVDEAVDFMVRYNYFWTGQNVLLHDFHGNSAVFEKTRCRVAVHLPDADGISYTSGMGVRDPEISAFQQRQRQLWLDQNGWDWNSPDACFFKCVQATWENMQRYMAELRMNPTFDNVKQLLEQRPTTGPLCFTGARTHPDDPLVAYTLRISIWLLDRKQLHRRQWRDNLPSYLDTPEIVQYV